jgi:hypothetical protein
METKYLVAVINTGKIVILISCICIISIIALDISLDIALDNAINKLYWVKSIFKEGWPNFSVRYIIRSIIIFISTIALFWSLIGSRRPKLVLSEGNGISLERVGIVMALFFSVFTLFLFIFRPSTFNALSKEDNFIEWGSAILLFGSCFITTFSLLKNNKALKNSNITRLSLVLLSFAFFIMAMEEVSWFQRVLEIETPKLFEGNQQKEMNFHNFATDYIEDLYYFGAFVFLVVFPFIRSLFPFISNNNYLRIFVARPFIGVIGSIACAYNFDMWNIIFTQIAFFSSLVILCAFAIFSSIRNERHIILFTIVLIITSQILFLANGKNFDRLFEITEYKEFIIPLAFFIYSWDVFIHIERTFLLKKNRIKAIL